MTRGLRSAGTALAVLVGTWAAGCTALPSSRLALSDVSADPEANRQILVTTPQPDSQSVALLGDPSTVYLRRRGYGPSPGVDRRLNAIAADYALDRVEGWTISSLGVYCEVYTVGPDQDIERVLDQIGRDPRVEAVQRMNVFETEALRYDDPYASMQPAIAALSINAAHERATGRGVKVAVIDSLIDRRHPELSGRVRYRRDFVGNGRRTRRPEIHGTAVAGIIASIANNAEGIVGVAPDVDLAALRACRTVDEETGRAACSTFSLARALEEALDLGADVVNMSLSGPNDPLLTDLIDVALERGTVVVAAMPDGGRYAFPASHPGVIAAGSPDAAALPLRADWLRAPGREVLSTTPDGRYAFFSGNSMSAAFVAGVSALLVEQRPGIGSDEVLRLLEETSTASSINACRAVARLSVDDCPAVNDDLNAARGAQLRTTR